MRLLSNSVTTAGPLSRWKNVLEEDAFANVAAANLAAQSGSRPGKGVMVVPRGPPLHRLRVRNRSLATSTHLGG